MTRGSRRLLLALATSVAVLWPAAASADDEIALSTDGTSWSDSVEEPLFDPDRRWAPGDVETATFHVRNDGPSTALLALEVTDLTGANSLGEDLALQARADEGEWIAVGDGRPSRELTEQTLERGGSARVDVRASFDPASGNASQVRAVRFRLDVRLADAASAGAPSPGPAEPDPSVVGDADAGDAGDAGGDGVVGGGSSTAAGLDRGQLPATGSSFGSAWLWAAAVALGAGLALLRARHKESHHV